MIADYLVSVISALLTHFPQLNLVTAACNPTKLCCLMMYAQLGRQMHCKLPSRQIILFPLEILRLYNLMFFMKPVYCFY